MRRVSWPYTEYFIDVKARMPLSSIVRTRGSAVRRPMRSHTRACDGNVIPPLVNVLGSYAHACTRTCSCAACMNRHAPGQVHTTVRFLYSYSTTYISSLVRSCN